MGPDVSRRVATVSMRTTNKNTSIPGEIAERSPDHAKVC